MNANKRMKYASTPTYGMQKRGFSKKTASAQQPSTPDFTRFPVQDPMSAPFPQQSIASFSPTGFPQNTGMPQPSAYPPITQTNPSPGGMPFQTQPPPLNNANFFQPMPATSAPSPMQQPLGNAPLVTHAQMNGFTPRQQGFVPQTSQSAMPSAQNPVINPQMGQLGSQAFSSPPIAPYMAQSTAPSLNPGLMGGSPMNMNPMQQPLMPMQPVQQVGPMQQMPPYPQQQTKAPRQPMDPDKLWIGFLFGLLPLLFIPCLFVGQALDFLRYAFIALCVIGLGAMWYRQMFTSSTRMTVSIIYAALCIVTISMLVNGSAAVRETGGTQAAMQATSEPGMQAATSPSQAPPEDTPAPISPPGQSEAELRLATFMDLWCANKSAEMVSYIQPSWASNRDNPAQELFVLLANRTPEEYTIESISGTDADNSRTVVMTALIQKNNGKESIRYRFTILMVKDGSDWYVDPNTLTTNDIATETDAAGATATSQATLQPRMTETPVPAADTMLYYNPNGGSYYHADPNCAKVDSQYLPLGGSFPYSELTAFLSTRSLDPCLVCRAPTTALE